MQSRQASIKQNRRQESSLRNSTEAMPHHQQTKYTISYSKIRRISITDVSTWKSRWECHSRDTVFLSAAPQPVLLTLTCIPSSLPCSLINTFQLSHSVLEGFHTALHAVSLLPVLPEGTDFFVQFFEFLCLTVYHSLYKTTAWVKITQRH